MKIRLKKLPVSTSALTDEDKTSVNAVVSQLKKMGMRFDKSLVHTTKGVVVTLSYKNEMPGIGIKFGNWCRKQAIPCNLDIKKELVDNKFYVSISFDSGTQPFNKVVFVTFDELYQNLHIEVD